MNHTISARGEKNVRIWDRFTGVKFTAYSKRRKAMSNFNIEISVYTFHTNMANKNTYTPCLSISRPKSTYTFGSTQRALFIIRSLFDPSTRARKRAGDSRMTCCHMYSLYDDPVPNCSASAFEFRQAVESPGMNLSIRNCTKTSSPS